MTTTTFEHFPALATRRFLLRRIVRADVDAVFQALSGPRVYATCGVSYDSLDATEKQMDWYEHLYASGTGIWWAICSPESKRELIGACGFSSLDSHHRRAEIGYWLLHDHWGCGIASECVEAIVSYGFRSLQLHRIAADVDIGNDRSSRLLEQLGFRFEGIRRGCELKNGTFLDLQCYSRLATDSWEG
jgi:ribosomal-protein-alanine N-acetyltransferase